MSQTPAADNDDLAPTPGDIVRLTTPYITRHGGLYTHGIVSEIVSHVRGPDSPPRSIGALLFNPRSDSLYLHNDDGHGRGVPETVDFNTDELVVVEQAEGRYQNEDPLADDYRASYGSFEGFLEHAPTTFPRCPRARWQSMQPFINAATNGGGLADAAFLHDELHGPTIRLEVRHGYSEGSLVLEAATGMGFEVDTTEEHPEQTVYYLRDTEVDAVYDERFNTDTDDDPA